MVVYFISYWMAARIFRSVRLSIHAYQLMYAFISLEEGISRTLTWVGLIIEFLTCFLGILIIPQIAHMIYIIVSNTIDKQSINDEKRNI